jgi:threonine/homoserine/homoserine lactone efflux protein
MLTLDQILLYLPAVAIIIGIPGPDMLMSLSRGLTQGKSAGIGHAIGAGVGIMAHSLLAALGVSALLTASTTAFWIMKLAGGAYLIYLGVLQWKHADATATVAAKRAPLIVIYWRGFLSNLLNPKVALFVLAFVPQFVRSGEGTSSPFVQMLLLGGIFSVLTMIAYGALGTLAGSVSRWLAAHPRAMRSVNRSSAGLFVASGAAVLLLDRRQ